MKSLVLILAAGGLMSCDRLNAQEISDPPPGALKITEVSVKPGQVEPLAKLSEANVRALTAAHWPRVSLAMRSLTGPAEILYLTGYENLGQWDDDRALLNKSPALKATLQENAQKGGMFIEGIRDITASFAKPFSYQPDFPWSDMRCVDVITVRLKPGHGDEYQANRAIVMAAHTRAEVHEHLLLYAVSSGTFSSTYLVIRPLASLHNLEAINEEHDSDKYSKALGDDNRKKLHELFAASVLSEEERYYCADPAMSYMTPGWAKTNKEFWAGASR